MDLEATWQEHRKFIISVGAGALAFGLFTMGVTAIEASADTLAKKNARENAEVLHAISALRGQEAAEKGKKVALEEKARPAIESAVTFKLDPAFVLAPEQKTNATIAFAKARATAADEVGKKADRAGATIPRKDSSHQPDLGFEEDVNVEGPRAAEAIARCDVTRQVAGAAIDVGVVKLIQVRQNGASYEPLEGGGGFVRRIPVEIVFEGTTAQLAQLLARFEKDGGQLLELGGCRVQRARDARAEDGRLEIQVELAALTIEKEAPADAAATPSDPGRRPRGRRRD